MAREYIDDDMRFLNLDEQMEVCKAIVALGEALERVLSDAGLEDDYATRDSDGRFISQSTLLAARGALANSRQQSGGVA